MDGVSSVRKTKLESAVTTPKDKPEKAKASGFEDLIRQNLHPVEGEVHEEDLFAALIDVQLRENVSTEAADEFQSQMASFMENNYTMEKAANRALKKVRVGGFIDRDEAHEFRNQAFGSAQLDDRPYQLFADRNGRIARGDVDEALGAADDQLSLYQSGAEIPLTGPERRAALRAEAASEGDVTIGAAKSKGRRANKARG